MLWLENSFHVSEFKKKFISLIVFGCIAGKILVPQPGIKPNVPVVEVHSLNHWTSMEVPE